MVEYTIYRYIRPCYGRINHIPVYSTLPWSSITYTGRPCHGRRIYHILVYSTLAWSNIPHLIGRNIPHLFGQNLKTLMYIDFCLFSYNSKFISTRCFDLTDITSPHLTLPTLTIFYCPSRVYHLPSNWCHRFSSPNFRSSWHRNTRITHQKLVKNTSQQLRSA